MNSTIKQIEQGTVELTVELAKEELADYVKTTEKELSQDVIIDGFRPGKAPQELINKHLDHKKVLEIALENAVQASLVKSVKEHKLDVAKSANLKIKENTAEKLLYSVTLNIFPEVTLPDLTKIKVLKKEVDVETKEVDEALQTIRSFRSTFTEKKDVAQEGDRIEVDFLASFDGKPIPGGESKNHPLIIGGKSFMPGFEENFIGLKKDDEKEFSLVAPKDYYQKDLAGKKLNFKIKVNQVQKVNMPELNDEFAKSLGAFNDVNNLKNNIQEGILHEKKQKERQRVCLDAIDKIIETTKVKTPEFLVKDSLNSMIANFDQDLHAKGLELGIYLSKLNKTQDDLRRDWQKDAERQAKIFLILHVIAKDQNISVSPEELDETVNQTVQALVSRGQADPANLNLDAVRGDIEEKLINEKTLDFIEKTCAA